MVLKRLEICLELVRLAIEFIVVVAEAVGIVIHQNDDRPVAITAVSRSFVGPVPFVGFGQFVILFYLCSSSGWD
ncbi:hypothetical protein PTKIN_Ptkin10aG0137600 [Pterospermum kingtungense]